jgi:hypothetical protein
MMQKIDKLKNGDAKGKRQGSVLDDSSRRERCYDKMPKLG